ncbi:MAG: hypothetical protein IKC49_03750 [Clostridia bacterium]|nr:hypothetical protein [Clostridia bacterium]
MNKIEIRSVLFLGIGGVSMHQLACAFKELGVQVFGYDVKSSKFTKICQDKGIKVIHKFDKDICNVDICIKTGAIKDNKYTKYLKKNNVKIIDRAVALNWLSKKFGTIIAVAGTHGKTTTATLIYQMLRQGGKSVSSHIGADISDSRFCLGDDFLVVEACEYNRSFLSLYPHISVITNVEAEHMDSYGSIFKLRSAFITFLRRANTRFVLKDKSTKFFSKYSGVEFVDNDIDIKPKLHGEHNKKNISLAVAVARRLGVEEKIIRKVITTFAGVERRYELIGKMKSMYVYIDYAHHPTELKALIDTLNIDHSDNLIVFQPHTYSRTKMFCKEFASVLKNVKNLIIYKEYPARENISQGMSAKELYGILKLQNDNVLYCASIKNLKKRIKDFDAVAFVGAGDIDMIARKIISKDQKQSKKTLDK